MKEFVEKLIERLEEEVFSAELHDYGWEGQTLHNLLVLGNVQVIAEDLASEHNNGWISVEDALPKEKGTYLVTVKHFGVTFARFTGQKDNLHFDANVIAWMEIPAPYKKGE